MSGANGAGEGVDGFGKFLFKFLEALRAAMGGVGVREKKPKQSSGPAEEHITGSEDDDGSEGQSGNGAEEQEISGANIDVSLGDAGIWLRTSSRTKAASGVVCSAGS